MNLYVLFAIALGAISGITEPVAAPRSLASVVKECGVRADEQPIADAGSGARQHHAAADRPTFRPLSQARIEAPLTGAAAPRAPATNC